MAKLVKRCALTTICIQRLIDTDRSRSTASAALSFEPICHTLFTLFFHSQVRDWTTTKTHSNNNTYLQHGAPLPVPERVYMKAIPEYPL